jgi:long-chain acyl-CoA synthetase
MKHPWDRPLGVWHIAENHPDQPAIAACPTGEVLSYSQLAGRAHQVVHAGRAAGLAYGDVVAAVLPNGIDMIVWMLAASETGWRLTTLNPMAAAAEIETIVAHAGARALVVSTEYAERAGRVVSAPLLVSVGGELPGYRRQEDLVAGHPTTKPAERRAGTPLIYTSGTTGRPKAIARNASMPDVDPADVDPADVADSMKLFSQAFRFLPLQGAHLISAGMHHGGCQGFFMGALHVGQALVIMKRFDPEETLRLIEKYRITTGYLVPTQFVRLLRLPDDVRTRYDLSSLQVVVHSAAPCPPEVKRQMFAWWGPVIWETYGGTEGAATIAKPHHWLARPGTVGRPVRGVRVRILDADGHELGPGERGTVYIDAGARTFAYRDDPEQTEQVYRGSAFTIGDIGHLDADGFLFLSDRAKDMIITGGTNVYPAEVEAALLGHPAVADVAVVGAPDPEWGEQVRAVVQPEPGVRADDELAAELIAYCRARLASYKCPRVVEFRAALLRTETGKLSKVAIRAQLWAGVDRRV